MIDCITQGNVELPEIDAARLERWLRAVADAHNRVLGPLTYIFCDDATILDVNRQFLSHDYYTDIITFDNTLGRRISGDMYISLDTVRSNAETVSHRPYSEELMRVIVHGVLHLCGINDKGPGEREVMENHENEALAMLASL
ncbi:MAG: rRNA maturation RNase YbeY [Muribaculaceae bacterium]|nr:rRNA maturation RNase YbeY [Muribaculaceae bacterium]MCF0214764.1 rRNA maturation RNase YbeY [Muribaculaceae bacterium]